MHALEQAVLGEFQRRPSEKLSTTELVRAVLPQGEEKARQFLDSMDPKQQRDGLREKARLHRKLLYHLNKLVDVGVLAVTGFRGRGEKMFSLAVDGNIEIIGKETTIRIHKPEHIHTPIDGRKEFRIYRREDWLRTVNTIFIEGERFTSLTELSARLVQLFPTLNDTLAVLRSENVLIGDEDYAQVLSLLEREAEYRRVSFIFRIAELKNIDAFVAFCTEYCSLRPQNIDVIFSVQTTEWQEHRELLRRVLPLFISSGVKLNIKNISVYTPPLVSGQAGPYTVMPRDWKLYCQEARGSRDGLVVSSSTLAIDVLELSQQKEPLHVAARLGVEALFLGERAKRKGFSQSLRLLREFNISTDFSHWALRLWNYPLEYDLLLQSFSSAKEVVVDFCALQERVYRACGTPIRCSAWLASAFGKFGGISARAYRKKTISGLSALEQLDTQLRLREKSARFFIGDRVRVFRKGGASPDAVFDELAYLLRTYSLPLFTYDFSQLRGDTKLTEFLS
ncbi:hypothetical protein GOV10_02395 [Candidatus Woesearchaeota archaeon]|nr:hypothetical protein [Candidatus Woesearchaeota archaeon]